MKFAEWLGSKKTKTGILAAVVPFITHYLGIPQEVAYASVGGLMSAIGGFAVQDYAKARDGMSEVQVDVLVKAVAAKFEAKQGDDGGAA